jgi:hypothetical protein
MKKYLYSFLLFIGLINAQNKEYVLDPAGKKSNFQYLFKKYPDNSMEFRITKDSGKVFQITAPKYEIVNTNYDTIRKILPEYPSKIKNDSLTYIIQFFYKNDHTFLDENNKFTDKNDTYINFIKTLKRSVEKENPNVKIYHIFEEGIDISNVKNYTYFISDKNSFFKTNFFKKSIVCGSFLIAKPNGQTLIRNGEYRIDSMANHLIPDIWNKIFSTINVNEKIEVKE